jgi:hypothetical protein
MLNIITPLYHLGNLSKIRQTIPNECNWIVVLCQQRQDLVDECNGLNLPFITINEPDTRESIHLKTNEGIKNAKKGHCYFLDDDTLFLPETLDVYLKYKHYQFIIGKQVMNFDNKIITRCEAQPPECGKVDGGQAIISTGLLKYVKLKSLATSECADGNFLKECYSIASLRKITDETTSIYNALR